MAGASHSKADNECFCSSLLSWSTLETRCAEAQERTSVSLSKQTTPVSCALRITLETWPLILHPDASYLVDKKTQQKNEIQRTHRSILRCNKWQIAREGESLTFKERRGGNVLKVLCDSSLRKSSETLYVLRVWLSFGCGTTGGKHREQENDGRFTAKWTFNFGAVEYKNKLSAGKWEDGRKCTNKEKPPFGESQTEINEDVWSEAVAAAGSCL